MKVTEIFDKYGVEYREPGSGNEHCRPGWVQIDCVDCTPGQHRFRLGFNVYRKNWNCWGCGPKRRDYIWAQILGVNASQAYAISRDIIPELLPETDRPVGKLKLPQGLDDLLPAHNKYLRGRGFDVGYLKTVWGVRGIGPLGGEFAWRIFIPVTLHGEIVSWTTRSIGDAHGLRYRSAGADEEKLNHKTLLYGEDIVPGQSVVIHEGPTDPWKTGPGAVCTFGTGFRMEQVLRLSKYRKRYVCYDNEPEGQKRAAELVRLLSPFDGETYNVVLDAKDAGSASEREIKRLRKLLGR